MSHDADIAQVYRDMRTIKRWRKERLTPQWLLAQAAATDKFMLIGSSAVFKSPDRQKIGQRKLVKGT